MKDVDDNFYARADAHIHLSNDQLAAQPGRGKVSGAKKLRWLQSPSAGVERLWELPDLMPGATAGDEGSG